MISPSPTSAPHPLVRCSTASAVHHRRFVGFVLFSWWWAWWCPKHVESPIKTSFLHLVGYFFTFMIQDARSHEIKKKRRDKDHSVKMDLIELTCNLKTPKGCQMICSKLSVRNFKVNFCPQLQSTTIFISFPWDLHNNLVLTKSCTEITWLSYTLLGRVA
jgi:hypothetical protein